MLLKDGKSKDILRAGPLGVALSSVALWGFTLSSAVLSGI